MALSEAEGHIHGFYDESGGIGSMPSRLRSIKILLLLTYYSLPISFIKPSRLNSACFSSSLSTYLHLADFHSSKISLTDWLDASTASIPLDPR